MFKGPIETSKRRRKKNNGQTCLLVLRSDGGMTVKGVSILVNERKKK